MKKAMEKDPRILVLYEMEIQIEVDLDPEELEASAEEFKDFIDELLNPNCLNFDQLPEGITTHQDKQLEIHREQHHRHRHTGRINFTPIGVDLLQNNNPCFVRKEFYPIDGYCLVPNEASEEMEVYGNGMFVKVPDAIEFGLLVQSTAEPIRMTKEEVHLEIQGISPKTKLN